MSIVMTGGGTGGHIFPVVSVVEKVIEMGVKPHEITWIGVKKGREEDEARKLGVKFVGIRPGKLRRYFSFKNFTDFFKVITSTIRSFFVMLKLKPEVIFAKGGFVSVPPVIAAGILKIPVIIHESDINPGLATRINSRFANIICVSFRETERFFMNKNVVFTGNPVRKIIKAGDGFKGKKFLGFEDNKPIVLFLGGSLGAESINRAVWELIKDYKPGFNVVHQCGSGKYRDDLGSIRGYKQYEFIYEEIGHVIAASDIVVSRAGAGAIYEIAYLNKPMLLIPLPKSKSRGEQLENANYMRRMGAAEVIKDEELNGKVLKERLDHLLNDKKRLVNMGKRAGELIKRESEEIISENILKYLKTQ